MLIRILRLFIFIFILTACQNKKEPNEVKIEPAEILYSNGLKKLIKGSYKEAGECFSKLSLDHPHSELAPDAQIMEAYANYLKRDYDQAKIIIEDFLRLYPAHKNIDYMYYLRALCYYEEISDIHHDQEITENAKNALEDVISRFPSSNYAKDSRIKIDLVNDHLAGKEMEIGRFYLKRGEVIAAINRFQTVVEKYNRTNHVQEALYRLAESYLMLGIVKEAKKNVSVLGYNYPDSKWYKYAFDLVKDK